MKKVTKGMSCASTRKKGMSRASTMNKTLLDFAEVPLEMPKMQRKMVWQYDSVVARLAKQTFKNFS